MGELLAVAALVAIAVLALRSAFHTEASAAAPWLSPGRRHLPAVAGDASVTDVRRLLAETPQPYEPECAECGGRLAFAKSVADGLLFRCTGEGHAWVQHNGAIFLTFRRRREFEAPVGGEHNR